MSGSQQARLPMIAQEKTDLRLPRKVYLVVTSFINRIVYSRLVRGVVRRLLPKPIRDFYWALRQEYPLVDKTQVILFTNDSSLLPSYTNRQKTAILVNPDHPAYKVSLVAVTFNQAADTRDWLESLLCQSCLPDEVVIADRGSTDGTLCVIDEFSGSTPFTIHLIDASGVTTADGRNLAIQNAAFPLIASTEVGCKPEVDWLHNLIAPLEVEANIQLSAGLHQALPGNNFQRLCAYFLTPDLIWFDPQNYIPSWRSIAMRKSLWVKTDGYPEWLGEDPAEILFGYQAKISPGQWAFVPQAQVSWRMPDSLAGLCRACYQEAKSNGKTGIRTSFYWNKFKKLVIFAGLAGFFLLAGILTPVLLGRWGWLIPLGILSLAGPLVARKLYTASRKFGVNITSAVVFPFLRVAVNLAQWRGFSAGVRERPEACQRQIDHYQSQLQQILGQHPDRKGIIIYPPTHDWGYMFQLPQQMARQFARCGYLYFYGTLNEKTDDVIGFRQVEPNLYICHVPFETFRMLERGSGGQPKPKPEKLILYIGSPWNRKYLSFFNDPVIIYDHYDDLAVSSGRLEDHQHLLHTADIVLVTSQRLLDNVKSVRPDTIFAPNGVDFEHFQVLHPAPDEAAPDDLQPILAKGKPVIGYTGVLSERFDYDLYLFLAKSRPEYEFVLIGANIDGSLERSGLLQTGLDNVSWLGMKSHDALIKYMWRFHVGIVPFKINEITLATTSIKVFEYMACQVPVVSVAMPESKRYPGVFIAETYDQFVTHIDAALKKKYDGDYLATIDRVARANTWGNRVDKIHGMIGKIHKLEQAGACDEQLIA